MMKYAITKTYDIDVEDNPYINNVPNWNVLELGSCFEEGFQLLDTFYTQEAAERYMQNLINNNI